MSTISGTLRITILLAALLVTGCATLPLPPVAPLGNGSAENTAAEIATADTAPASPVDAHPLVGVEWRLQAIRMMNGETFTPGATDLYTLALDADGMAGGQADCNRFGGTYTLDNGLMRFGPLNSTRIACPPNSLSEQFLEALAQAKAYEYSQNGNLSIAFGFGPEVNILEFVSVAPEMTGTGITEVDLSNAAYQGIYDEAVQLTDGLFEGEPFVAGGASRPTLNLLPDLTALGDLNGDGAGDGVAILAENSGGSGTFIYLAAVVAQDGTPVNAATLLLGDRVRVESVAVEDGKVVLVAGTFAENDPLCCPSQRTRFVFELQGGEVVELSAETL